MNDVSLVSADSVPLEVVWRAFVDGFRDYVVPVELSFDEFEQVIADEKISLAASVVAVRDGVEPCGAAMLAIRTAESWCGGLGVVPSVRRTGLGRRMMLAIIKEARTRGVTRMRLECIDGNHAAWSLYEGIGFRPARRLEIFRGAATPRPDAWKAASIWPLGDPGLVWNRFAAYHPVPPAWQTDLPVLRRHNPQRLLGWAIGDTERPRSYVLFRAFGDLVRIVDSGSSVPEQAADHLAMLVATLVESNPRCNLIAHNLPMENSLNAVLRDAGVPVVLAQTELELRF